MPLRQYVTEAVEEKLKSDASQEEKPWLKHLGKLKHLRKETARINRLIEEDSEEIDPEIEARAGLARAVANFFDLPIANNAIILGGICCARSLPAHCSECFRLLHGAPQFRSPHSNQYFVGAVVLTLLES